MRHQRRPRLTTILIRALFIVVMFALMLLAWDKLLNSPESPLGQQAVVIEPTSLPRADVLPTPTLEPDLAARRRIVFPGALLDATIVMASRTAQSWEMRNFQGNLVGLLQGTSWLDDPGGNIVLAGHVDDPYGRPGAFKHLSEAQIGDTVMLREGDREITYRVTSIETAKSEDIQFVAQDGRERLTLITCTDWDFGVNEYLGRLIVIAEPVATSS